MTCLSVNINKIATLRNARGGRLPSVVDAAVNIQKFGAHGITVHPRPDERHITRQDVLDLKKVITTEFNIESYPSEDFFELVKSTHPEQVTLVPDPPEVLTSNAGWSVNKNQELLKHSVSQLKKHCSRISIFVEPQTCNKNDLQILRELGVQRIELYTEAFAQAYLENQYSAVLNDYKRFIELALEQGLEANAGHDLDQKNLKTFIDHCPQVKEVSIGHALISESLYEGLETTVQNYLKILAK